MLSAEIAVSSKAVGNNNQDTDNLSVKASLGGGGGGRGKYTTGSSTAKALPIPPASRCPRCDSPNTKFCYYNNYSLAQPRHFCKTCRRYWTKGGALRNVPIGGGCRKNNKSKSKSSSTSTSSVDYSSKDYSSTSYLFSDNIPGSGGSGFLLNSSLFHGLNSLPSSSALGVCHQHDQLGGRIPFSLLNSSTTTGTTTPCFDVDATAGSLMNVGGFSTYNDNLAGSSSTPAFRRDQQETCPSTVTNGYQGSYHRDHFTSSIEYLSNMNQELHWKLQQQRLAMLFGVRNHQHNTSFDTSSEVAGLNIENQLQHAQKLPLPVSFQNLEISKQEATGAVSIDQIVGLQRGIHDEGDDSAQNTTDQWSIFDKYNSNNSAPINTVTTGANEKVIGSWNDIQAWNTTITGHQHFAPLM
ncbi:hypothetical protein C5167_010899 [Papaver somniferum]|uniref:Dof zinc finger protein n=1 Tax=Papaver somniferum TaxID=3469 RepID=A0A4Y7K5M4_PAPSO|nr:dof zinc finger protein DOF5.7-like [Papaver somniferum]RZC67219.1 hypothetical protein C5167_010899 [Papaver somniferum]